MHRPQLMSLCEIELTSMQMQQKVGELRFENCFEVSSIGNGSGWVIL